MRKPVDLKNVQPTNRPAIERYLDGFHWAEQKTPGVYEALVVLANQRKRDYRMVKREVLVAAVQLVLPQKHEAQPIRIGTKWVGGSRTPVVPLSLNEQDFAAWLMQETHKAANALALGQPYPDTGADAAYREFQNLADHVNSGSREWNGKKETLYLLAGEGGSDDDDYERRWDDDDDHLALSRLLEELPERDRSLLVSLGEGKSLAQVARETGRSPGAVRTEWSRLRPRLGKRHAELYESLCQREEYDCEDEEDDQGSGNDAGGFEGRVSRAKAFDLVRDEVKNQWKELCERNPRFVLQECVRYTERNPYNRIVIRFKQFVARQKHLGPDHYSEGMELDICRCRESIAIMARDQWIYEETDSIRRERFPERFD